MADRPYWEEVREYIYDIGGSTLRTQEEIDARIETSFGIYNHFTYDQDEIEPEFTGRMRTFYDPVDLVRWIEEAGIPESCVQIWAYEEEEDIEYHIYVSPNTP